MRRNNKPTVSMKAIIGSGYDEFFHCRNFYRVVKGGRGSKKSTTTAICYIHDILKYPWANILVVRRFSNTNRQSTYQDLKRATERLHVKHRFKFNDSLPEITVKSTGQKIIFRGADDPYKITSISVDTGVLCWAWFEECYQLESQDKFDTIIESIRGKYDSPDFYKQITITFNPWSSRSWLKKEFFDEETKRPDTFAITTTYKCNEWLDEQDKARYEDLWRTNPSRARIVAGGDWGISEGLVFNDNIKVVDFNIDEIKENAPYITRGADFGFTNDPTTLMELGIDVGKRKIWIFGEHYQKRMITDDIFNLIKRKGLLKETIIADSAEPRLIAELQSKGAKVVPSSKGKGSISAGIDFMKGFTIYVHPTCQHTIEEFETYTYKKDSMDQWTNTPIDKNNHTIDAIRYALEPYHFKTNKKKNQNKAKRNVIRSMRGLL